MSTSVISSEPAARAVALPHHCTFAEAEWRALAKHWYPIAYSDEIVDKPLARTLLDQPLIVYRTTGRKAVVARDLCIHRGVPLRLGWQEGDELVCAYHGFRYGADGRCTKVPAQPDLPRLRCDPVLLRRALDNLLDNAVKHAPDSRIELNVASEDQLLTFEVMDLGPGMTEKQASHAFDPFYRADDSRDRRSGGVGLGLSIVRRVIEAHGGIIELETAPGRGTSFTARIPLKKPD